MRGYGRSNRKAATPKPDKELEKEVEKAEERQSPKTDSK